ncbi:MAG: heparinase II/III family protein [Planctomycetota bacterium]
MIRSISREHAVPAAVRGLLAALVAMLALLGFAQPAGAQPDAAGGAQPGVQASDGQSERAFERRLRRLELAEAPRLMLTTERQQTLRGLVERDPLAGRWFATVRRQADRLMDDAVVRHELPDGTRMLPVSREVLYRAYTLGMVYRITGEARYAERLWIELESAAGFPDWNADKHFLDAAEMAHAFAIGIDWLSDWLPDERRRFLVDAVSRNALEPAAKAYGSPGRGRGWWVTRYDSNWNAVCNGGVILAALAVADDRPELASTVLTKAVRSLRPHIRAYGMDGGWAEGPSYWSYGTRYLAPALHSLETAVGDELALGTWPGFRQTGNFAIALTTPTGGVFNFADASERFRMQTPQMHFFASRYGEPQWAAFAGATARPDARDLLWYVPAGESNVAWPPTREQAPPLAQVFRGVGVVVMRSDWADPGASFVGFKLGRTGVPHGHLDLGSFVYEAAGVRWAIDPGPDSYLLPGYFEDHASGRRWNYYRLRAEGHNAPVVNPGPGPDQGLGVEAELLAFEGRRGAAKRGALAVAELTPAYEAAGAEGVARGVELFDDGSLRVRDEVLLKRPGRYAWVMTTRAEIDLSDDGRTAWLSQDGKRLAVRLRQPSGLRFDVIPAEPLPGAPRPAGQRLMHDAKRLAVWMDRVQTAEVVVNFALDPQTGGPMRPMSETESVRPLRRWAAQSTPVDADAPQVATPE